MEWPIFYKSELKLGKGSAAICTLWTKKEIIWKALDEGGYSVCANLYTIQGINPLIKNVLARPEIRTIILCGADLMKSGDAILNLMKNGIDAERKIIGSAGIIDSNIPLDALEKFRQNVHIIDMRGKESEIASEIAKYTNQESFMEPLFITELDKVSFPLYTKEPVFKIFGRSPDEAWLKALDVVTKFGDEKPTEYNAKMKEVIGIVAVIEEDIESVFLSKEDAENYYKTVFSAQKPDGVEYTYGERLFSFNGRNQIKQVIERIKATPYTRRATAVTWDISKDSESNNPPCLTQIMWNVKDKKLYQTCIFRSHDIFGAWPLNAYAMRRLQKYMAQELAMETGHLVILSNSAHVYEHDWRRAEDMVHNNYSGKITTFEEDENGYFVLNVDNGEISVQHYLKDGRKSDYLFRGTKAQVLYRQITHENLFSRYDHAAYIGHELARAETCLKNGKRYVQDEA
ncbi:MAG: DUF4346 domain-containing protein [Candidatus Aenigmarchaeota archaeon]|nr:DUF4346 domain-containing protein [Candidatus Aenigmarchaeota archaeon]